MARVRRVRAGHLGQCGKSQTHIHYYAFDILVSREREPLQLPLERRREILPFASFQCPAATAACSLP